MLVGTAESSAVDDSAASERSRLQSECRRSDCAGVDGCTAAPSAHAADVCQPRLPRRQGIRRSQREKSLNRLFLVETEHTVVSDQKLQRSQPALPCWNPLCCVQKSGNLRLCMTAGFFLVDRQHQSSFCWLSVYYAVLNCVLAANTFVTV